MPNGKKLKFATKRRKSVPRTITAVVVKPKSKKRGIPSRTFAVVTKPVRYATFCGQYTFSMALSTLTNSSSQIFRVNSLYDPDFSNVSKNTVINGWTEAQKLYGNYLVLSCKCSVTVWNMSTTTCTEAVCSITDQNTFSSSLRATDIATRPTAKSVVLGPLGSNDSSHTFYMNVNIPKALGIVHKQYTSDLVYANNMASNPTFPVFVGITGSPLPEGSGGTSTLLVRYKFAMYSRLGNPNEALNDV